MRALLIALLAAAGGVVVVTLAAAGAIDGSPTARLNGPPATPSHGVADIPDRYLALYLTAGHEYGVAWSLLAAIGKIESDHGRSGSPGVRSGVNFLGCCAGPMQFLVNPAFSGGGATTWDAYGTDGNDDGRRDPYDPADAIPSAASYLAALYEQHRDWPRAIWGYNHSEDYVRDVLTRAAQYRTAAIQAPLLTLLPSEPVGVQVTVPEAVAGRPGITLDRAIFPTAVTIARSFGLVISSGYRDPVANRDGGGAQRSDHLCGLAADFAGPIDRMARLEHWARDQGFAWVDGPVRNIDARHGDHVHISFACCR